ncbi:MAG: efflux RND transporter permease subunit [Steroidobacteraceae bacterium]
MRQISAWAIRNPVSPVVLFVVLTFVGIVSFIRLPINQDPDVTFPFVTVSVTQPGAAPAELEAQVTQKIEGSVASVMGVRNIVSIAREGNTWMNIEFELGTPLDRAVNDVRDAVAKIRADLPEGINEPVVQRMDMDGGAIAYYAVGSTAMSQQDLSWFVDNTISKRLLSIDGVAQASRGGGVDREMRVLLDPSRMQALGITAVEVNNQLRQRNVDAAGGRVQVGGGEQAIRVLGGAGSAEQLSEVQIAVAGGRNVRLGDIADVRDSVAERRTISRWNGREATNFGVFKARGSSDVATLGRVEAELAKIRTQFPDVRITRVFTTVDHTMASYHSALWTLFEGALLAVVVVFLFLRDWRSTALSALAIPLSAIPTFAFMQWMGFTLNGVTLLALSLVAGVLVDDAIVEIENIVRHMRMGKDGYRAALEAADEIGLAVVATSSTIIAVFLPVSFMSGIVGQYFKQFGLTVAAAVFFSLLVARLITPLLAAYFLKPHENLRSADGPIMERYLQLLKWCALHRWRTVAAGTGFFAVSIVALAMLPQTFIPPGDFGTSQLNIELPPGVLLDDTARVSDQLAKIIRKQPEVTDVIESIGDNDEVRRATQYITLLPRHEREASQLQFERRVIDELKTIPDVRVSFNSQSMGLGRDISIYLTGDDPKLLEDTAHQVIREMRELPQVRDPRINGDYKRPEILVRPRQEIAAELGVSAAAISQTIRIATIGELPQNAAKFSLSDRQIPIRVTLQESSRQDLSTLENLPVPTSSGTTVPLKAVADLSFGLGPTTVRRYNQSRRLALEADLNGVQLSEAMKAINNMPTMKNLPTGIRKVDVGQAEFMADMFMSFILAMAAGVLMVFAVLVLLFVRVFQPITILSALPLSIGGAAMALFLTGNPFSMPVVIGILMLMGIVAKNSILLVDFAIEEIRAGRNRLDALIEAGHKRARPIVMTTVAMVAGMLPAALNLHGNGEFRSPMAIAVIGGLLTSTALTLVVVPAAFTIIDDFERWLAPRFRKALVHKGEPSVGTRPQSEPLG